MNKDKLLAIILGISNVLLIVSIIIEIAKFFNDDENYDEE